MYWMQYRMECWLNMHLNNHNKWHHSILFIDGKLHLYTATIRVAAAAAAAKKVTWNNNHKRFDFHLKKTENLFKSYANKQLSSVIHNQRMDKHYTHTHKRKSFSLRFLFLFHFVLFLFLFLLQYNILSCVCVWQR